MRRIFRNLFARSMSSLPLRPIRKQRQRLSLNRLEDRTVPAIFLVSNLNPNGPGSLDQAIIDSNNDANADADVIDATSLSGTITLITQLSAIAPLASVGVSINGPGAGKLTVDAAGTGRILQIVGNGALAVSISGMTLTNGVVVGGTGGAIDSIDAALTLTNMVLTKNSADGLGGALLVNATISGGLTATNVTFSSNTSASTNQGAGGAIALLGVATSSMTACTITGNKATVGGSGGFGSASTGDVFFGNCTITNNTTSATGNGGLMRALAAANFKMDQCTVSGNSAGSAGGVMLFAVATAANTIEIFNSTFNNNVSANSGGVLATSGGDGIFTIRNSTFSGNTCSLNGGVIRTFTAGTMTFNIQNSTFTNNKGSSAAGSINRSFGTFNIDSCIFAQDQVDASTFPRSFTGTFASVINSVVGDKGVAVFTTSTGSVVGTDAVPVNAKLGALTSNGGPTQTHAITLGSPAIDIGANPGGVANDQRGAPFARVIGLKADAGAIEIDPNAPTATGALPDILTSVATYQFNVTYTDKTKINVGTLDGNDIRVTGPGGYNVLAKFISASPGTSAATEVATYEIAGPGANLTFDAIENGFYPVSIEAGQVLNGSGSPVAPSGLGNIRVAIPQNFVVDITTDENDGNFNKGDLSLREAIIQSNNSIAVDTVSFDPVVFAAAQTITLTLGEMTISDSVTVEGSGKVTIDANLLSRHFNVNGPGQIAVNLNGMTLTKGNVVDDGGSIVMSDEILTLNNMSLTSNTAGVDGGAIDTNTNTAFLNINDSTLSKNIASVGTGGHGGAINNDGQARVTIQRSTLSGNEAADSGGGIYFLNGGNLAISSSTISGNTANTGGVGIGGGGIYFFGASGFGFGFTITNSTISGNLALSGSGGGICLDTFTGTAVISNSTITGNDAFLAGGGIAQIGGTGTVTLQSTIVSDNTVAGADADTSDLSFDVAAVIAGNNNLVGIMEATNNATFATPGTQLTGTLATPLDAKLGTLTNNGGPTETHALLAGSPALNAGNNVAAVANDQRGLGFARVGGASADIGAFEFQVAATAKVSSVSINSKLLTAIDKAQRSYVSDVAITFDSIVTFTGTPEAAFSLNKVGGGSVTVSANVNNTGPGTVVTLTFTGGSVNATSLADGRYALHVLSAGVTGGLVGGDFIFDEPASPATLDTSKIFRIYGDYEGDGDVDTADFIQFRLALGNSSPPFQLFDFDNDGAVATSDFIQFRLRFGGAI